MNSVDMQLNILLPDKVFMQVQGIEQIIVTTPQGALGLLPHRLDCVAALVPSILMYQTQDRQQHYMAVDRGVLVKTGPKVNVSVRNAIANKGLEVLRAAIEQDYLQLDQQAQALRVVLAKMESGFVHHLAASQHQEHNQ